MSVPYNHKPNHTDPTNPIERLIKCFYRLAATGRQARAEILAIRNIQRVNRGLGFKCRLETISDR